MKRSFGWILSSCLLIILLLCTNALSITNALPRSRADREFQKFVYDVDTNVSFYIYLAAPGTITNRLPLHINDREFQKFVYDSDTNVCIRAIAVNFATNDPATGYILYTDGTNRYWGSVGVMVEVDPVFTNWLSTNAYIQVEVDPVFTNWLGTNTYVQIETDPIFTNWVNTNTYVKTEVDPLSLHTNGDNLMGGHIRFAASNIYDVGSVTNPVRHFYGGTGSYYLGSQTLTALYEAADGSLSNNIQAAYQSADGTLSNNMAAMYAAADSTLSNSIIVLYTAADGTLSNNLITLYSVADSTVSNNLAAMYAAADLIISNAFDAADIGVTNTIIGLIGSVFQAWDSDLDDWALVGTNEVVNTNMLDAMDFSVTDGIVSLSSTNIRYIDLSYGDMWVDSILGVEPVSTGAGAEPVPELSLKTGYTKLSATVASVWYTAFRIPDGYSTNTDYCKIKFTAKADGTSSIITNDVIAKKRTGIDAVGSELINTGPQGMTTNDVEYTFDMSSNNLVVNDWILVMFTNANLDLDSAFYDNFYVEYKGK